MERQIAPADLAPKRNVGLMAAAAAIVVLLIAGGIWFATRKKLEPVPTTTTVASGTAVTSTATAPMSPSDGLLLLSATPWADIDKIVNTKDDTEVPLTSDLSSTPAAIPLKPGEYSITLLDSSQQPKTITVTVEGGKPTRHRVDLGKVNYDELYREVTKP
jgi:hypothetical protein